MHDGQTTRTLAATNLTELENFPTPMFVKNKKTWDELA